MEPVTGIEPAFSIWKTDVLPLNYTDRSERTRGSELPFPLRQRSVSKESTHVGW